MIPNAAELPASGSQDLERLRAAGRVERWSMAQHNLNLYYSVAVSCYYSTLVAAASKAVVFAALATVVNQHSILSAIPVGEHTSTPYYSRLVKIDLEKAVTFKIRDGPELERDQDLDTLLGLVHNKSFKGNYGKLPFWHLFIIQESVCSKDFIASFVYHHAIGDGVSGVIFHKHFLAALQADPQPLLTPTIFPTKGVLLPSLDEIHKLEINPSPPPKPNTEGLWTGELITLNPINHFKSLSIQKNTMDMFIAVCREQNSSITATIQVLVAATLFPLLPEKFTQLHIPTLICIRRWLDKPISQDVMGNFYDSTRDSYQRTNLPSFSWSEARRSRDNMCKYMEAEGKYLGIQALQNMEDANQVLQSRIGKERPYSFGISNLGFVGSKHGPNDKIKGAWERGRMVFSSSSPCMGSAFSITLITGADGCLVVGFIWACGSLENKIINDLMVGVKSGIIELSRGSVLPIVNDSPRGHGSSDGSGDA